ncbi:hypothetical protein P4S73_10395 [Paraglaciecola sp. Hal342]
MQPALGVQVAGVLPVVLLPVVLIPFVPLPLPLLPEGVFLSTDRQIGFVDREHSQLR